MGSFIPVFSMGLNVLRVPLHKIMLFPDLFQGEVAVSVRPNKNEAEFSDVFGACAVMRAMKRAQLDEKSPQRMTVHSSMM